MDASWCLVKENSANCYNCSWWFGSAIWNPRLPFYWASRISRHIQTTPAAVSHWLNAWLSVISGSISQWISWKLCAANSKLSKSKVLKRRRISIRPPTRCWWRERARSAWYPARMVPHSRHRATRDGLAAKIRLHQQFGMGQKPLQGGCPFDSVQLVNITPITMVFVGDISIIFMGFINNFLTFGGHHLV